MLANLVVMPEEKSASTTSRVIFCQLVARDLLYVTGRTVYIMVVCYTSCGALAGTKNSSMGPQEGLIQ